MLSRKTEESPTIPKFFPLSSNRRRTVGETVGEPVKNRYT